MSTKQQSRKGSLFFQQRNDLRLLNILMVIVSNYNELSRKQLSIDYYVVT